MPNIVPTKKIQLIHRNALAYSCAHLNLLELFGVDVAVTVEVEHPESDLELPPEQQ